jgi:hypothetical protein
MPRLVTAAGATAAATGGAGTTATYLLSGAVGIDGLGVTSRQNPLGLFLTARTISALVGFAEWAHQFKLIFTAFTNILVDWHIHLSMLSLIVFPYFRQC